jgi:TIGR03009 family protein
VGEFMQTSLSRPTCAGLGLAIWLAFTLNAQQRGPTPQRGPIPQNAQGQTFGQSPQSGNQPLNQPRPTPARTTINQPQAPRPPQGFELTADQQKWVDQVLGYWEHRSSQVSTFTCRFSRWEYNPHFVQDPKTPWTEATGEIKYAKPDKALYRTDQIRRYQAPADPRGKPQFIVDKNEVGEYFICDGQSTLEFDTRNKEVVERPLPEHMRGAAIADGPLPFLFGAEAAKLKERYWVAPLTPPKDPKTGQFIQGEYWLAVKPKTRQDAENFELVELIIDQQEFLPKAMQIYLPGGQERKVFQFSDRTVNPRWEFLKGDFSKPRVPLGWKKRVEGSQAARAEAQANPRVRQASHIPVGQPRQ